MKVLGNQNRCTYLINCFVLGGIAATLIQEKNWSPRVQCWDQRVRLSSGGDRKLRHTTPQILWSSLKSWGLLWAMFCYVDYIKHVRLRKANIYTDPDNIYSNILPYVTLSNICNI